MKVTNVSHQADTGGNGWRTKLAFSRRTDWDYRTACRTTNYIDYPQDLLWEHAREHWVASDVVHVRDGFHAQFWLDAPDRPTVIHHHGTQFRLKKKELLHEQRRRKATGLAATLDLYLDAPDDLRWMPAIYDLDRLWKLRTENYTSSEVLRIGHAPTNRKVKSTETFLRAAAKLSTKIPLEVVLIEKKPWARCLELKASVDVYFDQVGLGYGNNAIEAWGMGIPVIAGAEERTLDEMQRRFRRLPFLSADEGTIYEALERMADPETRETWSIRGNKHAQNWHSEGAVVPMLKQVYAETAR